MQQVTSLYNLHCVQDLQKLNSALEYTNALYVQLLLCLYINNYKIVPSTSTRS